MIRWMIDMKWINEKWRDIKDSKVYAELFRYPFVYIGVVAYIIADKVTGSPPMKAREIVLLILVLLSGIRIMIEDVNQ